MNALLPLESNPDVLTNYMHKLGVSKKWALTDVVGLEPEMLEWVPKPVKSIILLIPLAASQEKEDSPNKPGDVKDLFYMKQITGNACGTVAIIHSVANNIDSIKLEDGILKKFLEHALPLDPHERGLALENDTVFQGSHQDLAQEGQTVASVQGVDHHFISLVNKDGNLYELDGRKGYPINHGETSEETFLNDAAKLCKEYMARDPENLRFTVLALVENQD